jgi:hypothetical protein
MYKKNKGSQGGLTARGEMKGNFKPFIIVVPYIINTYYFLSWLELAGKNWTVT